MSKNILTIKNLEKIYETDSEKLTVLNFGRVLAEGETKDVLSDPEVIKAHLGE